MAAPVPLVVLALLATAVAVARAAGFETGVLERPVDGPAAVAKAPVPTAAAPLVLPGRPGSSASASVLRLSASRVSVPPGATPSAIPGPTRGWRWPLAPTPVVVHPFSVGPHPWSAGHRGVDLGGTAMQALMAPADGMVTFAGTVAGRGVLVIAHSGGMTTTYEPVSATVPVGRHVVAGDVVGLLAPAPSHCGAQACLHWGAVSSGRYVDPLGLLARRAPPVLLPLP